MSRKEVGLALVLIAVLAALYLGGPIIGLGAATAAIVLATTAALSAAIEEVAPAPGQKNGAGPLRTWRRWRS